MSDRELPAEIYVVFSKRGVDLAFEDRHAAMEHAGDGAAQLRHEGPWMVEKYVRQSNQLSGVSGGLQAAQATPPASPDNLRDAVMLLSKIIAYPNSREKNIEAARGWLQQSGLTSPLRDATIDAIEEGIENNSCKPIDVNPK